MSNGLRRTILTALGIFNVALGTAGIFLPLLPTTPFLLLAAYLFARSDPRLHGWLLSHPRLGPYISAFRNRNGLTRTQKLRIGSSLTIVMAFSTYVARSRGEGVPGRHLVVLDGDVAANEDVADCQSVAAAER